MSEGQERSHEATPRRKRQARMQGDSVHSAIMAAALCVSLALLAAYMLRAEVNRGIRLMADGLSAAASIRAAEPAALFAATARARAQIVAATAVSSLITFVASFFGAALCGSIGLSFSALKPKMSRFASASGLARLASKRQASQAAFAMVAVACIVLLVRQPFTAALQSMAAADGFQPQILLAASALGRFWQRAAVALLVVGAADVIVQRRGQAQRLRMTAREVREERAQTEARPEMKQRRKTVGLRRSRSLRVAAIRRATAVIVNPTHVAVALRYAPPSIDVPVVVARGADRSAAIVRETALSCGVPIVESPDLARLLYGRVDIDSPIPEECYAAVAAIFAWIVNTHGFLRGADERPATEPLAGFTTKCGHP
ncbi:MAG: EscU/YscU/HrcU family type III secretion system export apparatus switch protein [Candidatus Eremiobacter antarcticus]|nr:EscU/YscU/HrcU family type III secretion system export apparatus switch protein [Candidatus Eremiobacteraeota bacterium]MBC5807766.1 EscU/YscU/HrcU family type III secretion system export apparatus switch protein [Candidatus Eremiobacteraeota bacterium]